MIDAIDNPIFIVGSGRSGTTLLRRMLNAHPRIYISHEASYYLMAPRAQSSGEWLDFYEKSAAFQWMRFSREEVAHAIPRDLPANKLSRAFDILMRIQAGRHGKPRYGDKTPFHGWALKRIFADFPGASVIHIVRNPADTIASLRCMPWSPRSIILLSLLLTAQHARMTMYRDRLLEVRMEDLLQSTEATLRKILDFVGEPWSPQVMHHETFAPQDDMPPFPWFEAARRAVSGNSEKNGTALPRLRNGQRILIELLCRRIFRRFDYPSCPPVDTNKRLSAFWEVIADLPTLCIDLVRMGQALVSMHRPKDIAHLPWVNPEAWKHYPEFRLQDVSEWAAGSVEKNAENTE